MEICRVLVQQYYSYISTYLVKFQGVAFPAIGRAGLKHGPGPIRASPPGPAWSWRGHVLDTESLIVIERGASISSGASFIASVPAAATLVQHFPGVSCIVYPEIQVSRPQVHAAKMPKCEYFPRKRGPPAVYKT